MKEKIGFGDIKSDIQSNREVNELNKAKEQWWFYYDSSLEGIGSTFYKVLPEKYSEIFNKKIYTKIEDLGEAFKKYIEETLSKDGNNKRTAIEFGGPGSKLFSEFSPGFFNQTMGVCLEDIRQDSEVKNDTLIGHSILTGDIFDIENTRKNNSLYSEIKYCFGASKVDLIISRMMGPLDEIRKNPVILDRVIRKWYELLNKNGILFAQFEYFKEHDQGMQKKYEAEIDPPCERESEKYVEQWVQALKQKFPNQIEIQLGRGVIRLVKKEGAPDELPSSKELFT